MEAPLTRQQLARASEVFVTNSVHGIMPVRAVTGSAATWPAGPAARRIAALLAARPAGAMPARRSGLADTDGLADTERSRSSHARPMAILVDNYGSFTCNLAHLLLAQHCQVEVIRNDEVAAEDIAAFGPAGIVISPGPCAPADADADISIDTVRRCSASASATRSSRPLTAARSSRHPGPSTGRHHPSLTTAAASSTACRSASRPPATTRSSLRRTRSRPA
jgi:hypothetical protein